MEQHTMSGDRLSAAVLAHGAELSSIRHAVAGEVLWQAGPAWPKHAPVLFPIVGVLAHDTLRHDGRSYPLERHGFARVRDFTWTHAGADSCTLRLTDDSATHAHFPFAFSLEIRYAIEGETLVTSYTLHNPGTEMLPASLGAHPAFRWPLAQAAKEEHRLTFACDEPEPIRRLTESLLDPHPFPTPIRGRELALAPALFDADAIVMDRVRSASVRYSAPASPSVEVAWSGFEQLGIWSKAGGDFICIEPWRGYASPAGFDGEFEHKPGLVHIAPGASARFELRITVTA